MVNQFSSFSVPFASLNFTGKRDGNRRDDQKRVYTPDSEPGYKTDICNSGGCNTGSLETKNRNLLDCISRRPIDVQGSGLKPTYYMTVLRYMRLLEIQYRNQDMKTRRKLALYNRVIWGVLYHETLSTLRYGLSENIKQSIREDLNESSPKNLD